MKLFLSLGHYIGSEQSSQRKQGDVSRLVSAVISPSLQATCFNFLYNMNGQNIGTLNIYVRYGDTATLIWTLSGDQGFNWTVGSFPLPQTSRTQSSQV